MLRNTLWVAQWAERHNMPKKKQIDWDQFNKLCAMQCTEEEIAAWFECSIDTIERACKREYKKTFAEYYKNARQTGFTSLRRTLWNKAIKENNTAMQIFLAKVILGYKENIEVSMQQTESYGRPESMKAIENL